MSAPPKKEETVKVCVRCRPLNSKEQRIGEVWIPIRTSYMQTIRDIKEQDVYMGSRDLAEMAMFVIMRGSQFNHTRRGQDPLPAWEIGQTG